MQDKSYARPGRWMYQCGVCAARFPKRGSFIHAGKRYCSRRCRATAAFLERVDKNGPDGCWLWLGSKNKGYGAATWDGKTQGAHRVSWLIHRGPIPRGVFVLHDCPIVDRPDCVNPAHLYRGTHADNMRDASVKGQSATGDRHGSHTHPERVGRGDRHGLRLHPERAAKGSAHGGAKLTEATVVEIRRRYIAGGVTITALATEHGVTVSYMRSLILGKTWTHVAGAATATKNHLKLPDVAVAEIKRRYLAGESSALELAESFGITGRYVRKLAAGVRRSGQNQAGPTPARGDSE